MSEIDLILLGLIIQKPQSAYDIEKQILYRNLSYWVKISKASIYKNIKQLETKNYIKKETIRNGNMPLKDIYSITQTGKDFFQKAILKISNKPLNFFLSINAVILNLEYVDSNYQEQCLNNMEQQIKILKQQITKSQAERQEIPMKGQMILKQQLCLTEYLENWLNEFREMLSVEEDNNEF